MRPLTANENVRLLHWSRVRAFAVPPTMIESATARRTAGDWAGACAAARVDVDLNLRAVGNTHGRQFAARLRADLRHLAPDLLRWHFPRIGPGGLVRPGLTVALARYGAVRLVARTPPAWAGAGQRISLALWDASRPRAGARGHPHPRPDRRFRLDLHRHLWDVRHAGELAERAGAGNWPVGRDPALAVHRWMAEAALVLRADSAVPDGAVPVGAVPDGTVPEGTVTVRYGSRALALTPSTATVTAVPRGHSRAGPVLPDAATWILPDLELLHAGLIDAARLHPLVASALLPGHRPAGVARAPASTGTVHLVECRGATHRIGMVNGVLAPLDHDPGEIRREELLVALGGRGLPCLQAIDDAHRAPENLVDVRARLDHGDTAGAVAAVEALLGPDAVLRDGALRDELETAVRRRVLHGLYRAELDDIGMVSRIHDPARDTTCRTHPRHASHR